MGVFSNIFSRAKNDERKDALPGLNIAVGSAEFYGSIHTNGDATVTVNSQYGERQGPAIDVEGSMHGSGNRSLTVENLYDYDDIPPELAPPEDRTPSDKAQSVHIRDRIDYADNVHAPGRLEKHIDTLIIVPDANASGRSWRVTPDRDMLKILGNSGYAVAERLEVRGSVHERGTLDLTIENLIVMSDRNL